jgi:pimeloyl-ACP methyl ester carboxylesterase
MDSREELLSRALAVHEPDALVVDQMMRDADRPAPHFWEPGVEEEIRVPVQGADLRVFHSPCADPAARRPVVMVPGFGATPEGFQDFYAALRGKAELFYLETREKPSSRITARRPDMSVSQSARDIQQALDHLGLSHGRDFLLLAPCWGAAIVLQGLIEGILDAPTIVVADPMHAMWFPKWLLRFAAPVVPVPLLRGLRPMIARSMLGDMQEPTQRERAYAFVYGADVWKWKTAGHAAWSFELIGKVGGIGREVFVLNGTKDKIHEQVFYPRIAAEMPRGRFVYMPTDERNRERLFGAVAVEFSRVSAQAGLPDSLARFEKNIR